MRKINKMSRFLLIFVMFTFLLTGSAYAQEIKLRISSGLPDGHCWNGGHMKPFADKIEKRTNGRVKFTRFSAGELCKAGLELECLRGGSIDVAAPFLAPYHADMFPLTDITMMPVNKVSTLETTRAFKNLVGSKVPLKDGKTFYQLEIESRDLVAWPVAPTDTYAVSTLSKRFKKISDFKGVPMRGGAPPILIFEKALGFTPVFMTASEQYEALSRGVIQGVVQSVPDWRAYGIQELLRYTITGLGVGNWPSYLAITRKTWDKLPIDIQKIWNDTAWEMADESAKYWIALREPVLKEAKEKFQAVFEDVSKLNPEVKAHFEKAAFTVWKEWIEGGEAKGRPYKATARLWASLIEKEGGKLPPGVKEFLAK